MGEYDRSVDGNGRLALPSTFRDLLGSRCYAKQEPSGCVSITSVEHFDRDAEHLMEQVRTGALPDSALRSFGVASSVVSVDKQGRITLDEELRAAAGIRPGTQVVIAGAIKQLQIWRPSRYRTIRSEDGVTEPTRTWPDEADETAERDA